MKRKVGLYPLGYEQVHLYLESGEDSRVRIITDRAGAEIYLGGDQSKWESVVFSLLHEAGELSLLRHSCRYYQTYDLSSDNGSYVFIMTHTQFSQCLYPVAEFLTACMDDLKKAWKKWPSGKKGGK